MEKRATEAERLENKSFPGNCVLPGDFGWRGFFLVLPH